MQEIRRNDLNHHGAVDMQWQTELESYIPPSKFASRLLIVEQGIRYCVKQCANCTWDGCNNEYLYIDSDLRTAANAAMQHLGESVNDDSSPLDLIQLFADKLAKQLDPNAEPVKLPSMTVIRKIGRGHDLPKPHPFTKQKTAAGNIVGASGHNYLMRTRDKFAGSYVYKSGAHSGEADINPLTNEKLDFHRRRSVENEQAWDLPFKQLASITVDPAAGDTKRLYKVEKHVRNSIRGLIKCSNQLKPGCALNDEYFIIVAEEEEREKIESALVNAFNSTVSGSSVPIDVCHSFEELLKQSLSAA